MTELKEPLTGAELLNNEERQLFEALGPVFEQERIRIAQMLASKSDGELFGQTEFDMRDRLLHLGAQSLETAAWERQKKGRVRRC